MTEKVLSWIRKENLINPGDTVVVGVSGGADSICLLLLLLKYRSVLDFELRVLHVEHGIRGEESRADAQFVRELCIEKEIPCRICSVDAPLYAKEHGIGLEEAARILRYDCFLQEALDIQQEKGQGESFPNYGNCPVKIALAHHADDNAETVLFQMVRGSGLKGLCGMRASREIGERIHVIRPLLMLSRSDIETYLQQQKQEFCVDSTNLDTDYSRNRIRHHIMPELAQVNSQAISHITQSASMLQELADYLDVQVKEILSHTAKREMNGTRLEAVELAKELFETYPDIIVGEIIHQTLGEVAGSLKDIGRVHVEGVMQLAKLQVGRSIVLPYGMTGARTYEGVRIARPTGESPVGDGEQIAHCAGGDGAKCPLSNAVKDEKERGQLYEISQQDLLRMEQGEPLCIRLLDGEMRLRILNYREKIGEIPKKTYTKWLDYDKIKGGLQIRRRMAGDYLTIDANGHRKKLKEYFVDEKIPGSRRSEIWLLAEASHILWVIGGRISADCKVGQETSRILEIQMTGGDYYED